MPALLVFVIGKTPFQIVGDAGVDAVVIALEKIDKIHKIHKIQSLAITLGAIFTFLWKQICVSKSVSYLRQCTRRLLALGTALPFGRLLRDMDSNHD